MSRAWEVAKAHGAAPDSAPFVAYVPDRGTPVWIVGEVWVRDSDCKFLH